VSTLLPHRASRLATLLVLLALLAGAFPLRAAPQTPPTPQPAATSRVFLPLLARGGSAVPAPQPPPPSSDELIAAAKASGAISHETAVLYRVYSVYGDPRLPAHLRGDDRGRSGGEALFAAEQERARLSPATQALLRPFLLPPTHPESALAQPRTGLAAVAPVSWGAVIAEQANAKIWWQTRFPEDEGRARRIAAELDRHIWPKFAGQFRAPNPDCGAACPDGGGDERVDLYIVPIARSSMRPVGAAVMNTGYILLERDATFGVIAHELMHLVQLAYAGDRIYYEYDWLAEATATWAMHFVYPTANNDPDFPLTNEEHPQAVNLLRHPQLPLEHKNDAHEYGAYLYFLFLNDPALVQRVWELSAMPDSLAALDLVTRARGGFATLWPQFTLRNLNRPPLDEYRTQDGLPYQAATEAELAPVGAMELEFAVAGVQHLAARYHVFDFKDPSIRFISFANPLAAGGNPGGQLWAVPTIDGKTLPPEDWTSWSRKQFCRDLPGQNLERVVLVVSNSTWDDRTGELEAEPGRLTTEPACRGGLSGTVSWTFSERTQLPNGSRGDFEQSVSLNLRLRYDEEQERYVDDGSTYNLTGVGYEELREVHTGELGIIRRWTERGSGPLSGGSSTVAASLGTEPALWLAATVELQREGTQTFFPSGQSLPFSGSDFASATCGHATGLAGKATGNGSARSFDMSCSWERGSATGSATLTVRGSITLLGTGE
jgi:hypothetical protein